MLRFLETSLPFLNFKKTMKDEMMNGTGATIGFYSTCTREISLFLDFNNTKQTLKGEAALSSADESIIN